MWRNYEIDILKTRLTMNRSMFEIDSREPFYWALVRGARH